MPPEIREQVLARWPLSLDAAACEDNTLTLSYLGPDHVEPARRDALVFEHWADLAGGGVVWLNPPYVPTVTLSSFLCRAVARTALWPFWNGSTHWRLTSPQLLAASRERTGAAGTRPLAGTGTAAGC
jgi:hypothetical protein